MSTVGFSKLYKNTSLVPVIHTLFGTIADKNSLQPLAGASMQSGNRRIAVVSIPGYKTVSAFFRDPIQAINGECQQTSKAV